MDRSVRFWDKIAERYSNRPIADEAAYRKKLEITREYFRPDMRVLEIGCGTGSTAIAHAPFVSHIQAIDISSKMIDIARSKADEQSVGNVTFQRSAVDDLSVADQTLDAVLGLSILHLLDDKDEVIARVYKMLKPGGIFVSSTACIADSMMFFKLIAPVGEFLGLMPSVNVFTTTDLVKSITDVGFLIERQWQPGKGKAVFMVTKKAE